MRLLLPHLNHPSSQVSSSTNTAKGKHRQLYPKKSGMSVLHSWMCAFFWVFFWLNPYFYLSPSGLLAPDATARLFSDWAIWAALGWSSIESRYSVISCWGCYFFWMCRLPRLEHTFKRVAQINGKQAFGQSVCISLSWNRQESVIQSVWFFIAKSYV